MTITIDAPGLMGATIVLTGDQVGSFLLHRNNQPTFINDDIKYFWCVTHVATGMKFPWDFPTKNSARSFAKAVESVLDWSGVKAAMRDKEPWNKKGQWVAGAPTKEQNAAIHELAEAHGALTK